MAVSNQDDDTVSACNHRPPVQLTVTPGNPGVLNVTVRAGVGAIFQVAFGSPRPMTNARVSVTGGPANQAQAFTFTPTNGQTVIYVTIQAENRNLVTSVPFTVTDGCGTWETMVGGGARSF